MITNFFISSYDSVARTKYCFTQMTMKSKRYLTDALRLRKATSRFFVMKVDITATTMCRLM
eukprot:snap_masked-scaffold_14-processed-gene-5.29-mRNA-1 protein AED:1.00 eAED:1.00 QI:0/0/0/0/1/1/2/0/60